MQSPRRSGRPVSRWIFLLGGWLLAAGAAPLTPAAQAHARLVRSEPTRGGTLTQAPVRLDLWFNELLDDGFNTVAVYPAGELRATRHGNLAREQPRVDPRDHTHLTLALGPLPPGDYVVDWRVLSRDGHTAPGRLTFRVSAP